MTTCTRCEGTGFLNIEQVPADIDCSDTDAVLGWMDDRDDQINQLSCSCHLNPPCPKCELLHDVQVCDCCGDGENWHGTPGEHYGPDDPMGPKGPYASNGGLCHCH